MIVIKGGEVLTATGWQVADVAIDDGRVVDVGRDLSGHESIDAVGCLVGPGFVDIHTHLREPGQTWKEDISSGSRASAAGGFTAVVAMPNTEPAIDDIKIVDQVRRRGEEVGLVDVVPAGALTVGRLGSELTDLEGLYDMGVRVFSDDGDPVEDRALTTQMMHRLADLPGAVMAQHAEVRSMTHDGHMHAGSVSKSLGVAGIPSEAESGLVQQDLELVAKSGVRYHCQHVSAAGTVDLIRSARRSGLAVTAEVTPHHLTLTDDDAAGLDPNFKMYPPLRTADDRDALVEALRDGVISAVATDHAPHSDEEQAVSFEDAPRGVIGLETSAALTWGVLRDRDRFFEVMATGPRTIATLGRQSIEVGATADLTVFDPNARWQVQGFESKSSNSPFLGRELRGRVVATIYRGVRTHG